jgi:hypothetical protein
MAGPGGAPVDIDPNRLIITCSGPQEYSASVVRESIGVFVASFRVMTPGAYTVGIKYDGNVVLSQPVSFSSCTVPYFFLPYQ